MSSVKFDALRALSRADYGITVERAITIIDALAPFFAPDPNAPDPTQAVRSDAEAQAALLGGRKINAIKEARRVLQSIGADASLTNAKKIVDAWVAECFPNLNSPF